ncbi:gluconate 2-dehydrogenase subunit 3 family protein [uncultured Dechloromonas sp.]|uniref:gluconate 2-dehydrogenase subunit 3 family protein n=1 Tax=uncultured Dechloromonas sp. TaxID=171719 RepID=UPI0025ECB69D|nr:gluconate 2-dehydrogenase subunit 3 family protein [uncultured Dechloromonas sp.]
MRQDHSLPAATRRLFIQRSVLALAAAFSPALLQAAANTPASKSTPPPKTLHALSADDYRLLSVVSDAIIPTDETPGASSIDLAARIDRYTAPDDKELIQGISGALLFIEHKAPELIGEKKAFSRLDSASKEKTLLAMNGASPLTNTVFTAIRGLCLFYFYTHEAGWKQIGYDGPLIQQANPSLKADA